MTAQAGRTLLLKVSDGASFVTVGGLRARSFELSQDMVDITHGESAGRWRELLGDAGVRRGRIEGAGIFRDEASDERVRALFFNGEVANWQIVVPDFGTIEGAFLVTQLDYSGEHDGAVAFSMTIESAGALAFAAA